MVGVAVYSRRPVAAYGQYQLLEAYSQALQSANPLDRPPVVSDWESALHRSAVSTSFGAFKAPQMGDSNGAMSGGSLIRGVV